MINPRNLYITWSIIFYLGILGEGWVSPNNTLGSEENAGNIYQTSNMIFDYFSHERNPLLQPVHTQSAKDLNDLGWIFFLKWNTAGERNIDSYYDLYFMDGNGDNMTFVMEKVSGTPAWSNDWKKLAIGCHNSQDLCILSIDETIQACSKLSTPAECGVISRHTLLPKIENDYSHLYNISWSSEGETIAIESRMTNLRRSLVYTRKVNSKSEWKLLYQGRDYYQFSWSPKENVVAFNGIDLLNYPKPIRLITGFSPVWSPDGNRIAFVKGSNDSSLDPYGIGLLDLEANDFSWLYKPKQKMPYGYYTDVIIHDDGNHKLLSWSPDEEFIVFISQTNGGIRSEIFRLNVTTGEIIQITDKGKNNIDEKGRYYAPAWGPS